LMSGGRPFRTEEDLDRTVRALAREFKTDEVFIVGSQGLLLAWPDSPVKIRATPEIDAYPANAKIWEIAERKINPLAEASEHIDALFGHGSQFHKTHGFFIDGVDENTAKLPKGWHRRAVVRLVDVDGRKVRAVAPCPEDLIVSKLARLDPKDRSFIEAYHAARPLDLDVIEKRILDSEFEGAAAEKAIAYVRALAKEQK
jgi:Nucleotidyltransferase of unknown function (DUF6036)